ncbi:MAG: AmmeMemoRadiSam system protein A [Bacteroidota bacterium]
MTISKKEKRILLQLARNSIHSLFQQAESPVIDLEKHPLFNSHKGAFVTLTIKKQLRGCIGYIISNTPLYNTVQDAAVQAAIGDPRFPQLSADEFNLISIEVSILSEPFKMNNYNEIVLGKHGLILSEGGQRGLLLPQVPIEHGMNKEEYLSALCEKAGFYPGLWRERILDIEMFTANVFSEKEIKNGSD